MMRRRCKILAISVLVAFCPFPGADAQGVLAQKSPTAMVKRAGDLFPSARTLRFSPAGTYVVADRDDQIVIARSDCLAAKGGECPAYVISNNSYFPRNGIGFSGDDRFLYFYEAGLGPEERAGASRIRRVTGEITVREVDVASLLAGAPGAERRHFSFSLSADFQHSIDFATDFHAMPDAEVTAYLARSRPIAETAVQLDTKLPTNVSNVFGRIAGDRYILLDRSDARYEVGCRTDRSLPRRLWRNGTAFNSLASNLPFRRDGADWITLSQGSALRISDCRLAVESKGKPRAELVNGDDPTAYYGYVTADGAELRHVAPQLARQVRTMVARVADQHVTGVAIHNGTGAAIVSHGSFVTWDADRGYRPAFQHDLLIAGRTVTLSAPGTLAAQHQVVSVGRGKLFVERYSRPGNKRHILYFYGGPGVSVTLGAAVPYDLGRMLDRGADIDIVHYGGSGYTFETKDRLYRKGTASLAEDGWLIERFVDDAYPAEAKVSLLLVSFGGQFFRHFSDRLLHRFDRIVLAAPSGSYSNYLQGISPLGVLQNQMNLGPSTVADANAYFAGLKTCPVTVPITLFIGRKDTTVDPESDYRLCTDPRFVRRIYHDFDHFRNRNLFSSADYRAAMDQMIDALVGETG